jgi:hypothetical protein
MQPGKAAPQFVAGFKVGCCGAALLGCSGAVQAFHHDWEDPAMEFVDPRQTPFAPLKSRGELPHLYKPSACYFVSYRLADALGIRPREIRVSLV